jgi:hypothetical protein
MMTTGRYPGWQAEARGLSGTLSPSHADAAGAVAAGPMDRHDSSNLLTVAGAAQALPSGGAPVSRLTGDSRRHLQSRWARQGAPRCAFYPHTKRSGDLPPGLAVPAAQPEIANP